MTHTSSFIGLPSKAPLVVVFGLFAAYCLKTVTVDCSTDPAQAARLKALAAYIKKQKLQDYPPFIHSYLRKFAAHVAEMGDCMIQKGGWTQADKDEHIDLIREYQTLKHTAGTEQETKNWFKTLNDDPKIRKFVETMFSGAIPFLECLRSMPVGREDFRMRP